MISLSVVIITYNEERNIGRCLKSVSTVADEIVVVDSFSSDRTEEICNSFGVRFIQNNFMGYVEQKNYANSLAEYPYILSLDADEALSDTLIKSISNVKARWDHDGYSMNRMTNYCGKWIKHGAWYPDRKIRLFDKKKAKWDGQLVHENLVLNDSSNVSFLRGDILHYSFYSISEHVIRSNYYSKLSAEQLFSKGKKAGCFKLIVKPCARFLSHYILRLGFLDGYYGFVISRITAYSTLLKYAKLRQLNLEKKKLDLENG